MSNLVNNNYKLWEHLQAILEVNTLETQIKGWEEEVATTKNVMRTLPSTDRKVAMKTTSALL